MPEDLIALPESLEKLIEEEQTRHEEEENNNNHIKIIKSQNIFNGICLSYIGFGTTFILILSTLTISTISAAMLYNKLQRLKIDNKDIDFITRKS